LQLSSPIAFPLCSAPIRSLSCTRPNYARWGHISNSWQNAGFTTSSTSFSTKTRKSCCQQFVRKSLPTPMTNYSDRTTPLVEADSNLRYSEMLAVAIGEAHKSLAEGGLPIGAAIFDANGKLLGAGHNRRVQNGDPSL